MAKITAETRVVETVDTVTMVLSRDEAEFVAALLYRVGGTGDYRDMQRDISGALYGLGITVRGSRALSYLSGKITVSAVSE